MRRSDVRCGLQILTHGVGSQLPTQSASIRPLGTLTYKLLDLFTMFPARWLESYLYRHVGQSYIGGVMSDGDFVGGLHVGFIEAGKGLASVCWLMISRSNLSGDGKKWRLLQKSVLKLFIPIIFHPSSWCRFRICLQLWNRLLHTEPDPKGTSKKIKLSFHYELLWTQTTCCNWTNTLVCQEKRPNH